MKNLINSLLLNRHQVQELTCHKVLQEAQKRAILHQSNSKIKQLINFLKMTTNQDGEKRAHQKKLRPLKSLRKEEGRIIKNTYLTF
jgi:hypothetical protein